jgi:hypothetical protein
LQKERPASEIASSDFVAGQIIFRSINLIIELLLKPDVDSLSQMRVLGLLHLLLLWHTVQQILSLLLCQIPRFAN